MLHVLFLNILRPFLYMISSKLQLERSIDNQVQVTAHGCGTTIYGEKNAANFRSKIHLSYDNIHFILLLQYQLSISEKLM